jgi:hypothetical protein
MVTSPAIAEFLSSALPQQGSQEHVLALGEQHHQPDYAASLRKLLPELKRDHRLGTLGMEIQPWFAPFLWAYQDGSLAQRFGSREAARRYVIAVNNARPINDIRHFDLSQQMELALDAMDQGIHVACFDSRRTLEQRQEEYAKGSKTYEKDLAALATKQRRSVDQVLRETDRDPTVLFQSSSNSDACRRGWMHRQVEMLHHLNAGYQPRLDTLEHLIEVGRERNLTTDPLNALLLDAQMKPGMHCVALNGIGHLDGKGGFQGSFGMHHTGTMPDHLALLAQEGRPAPKVTSAVIAGVVPLTEMRTRLEHLREAKPKDTRLLHLLNIDGSHGNVVLHRSSKHHGMVKKHGNLLLLPDIKSAFDAVAQQEHPQAKAASRGD